MILTPRCSACTWTSEWQVTLPILLFPLSPSTYPLLYINPSFSIPLSTYLSIHLFRSIHPSRPLSPSTHPSLHIYPFLSISPLSPPTYPPTSLDLPIHLYTSIHPSLPPHPPPPSPPTYPSTSLDLPIHLCTSTHPSLPPLAPSTNLSHLSQPTNSSIFLAKPTPHPVPLFPYSFLHLSLSTYSHIHPSIHPPTSFQLSIHPCISPTFLHSSMISLHLPIVPSFLSTYPGLPDWLFRRQIPEYCFSQFGWLKKIHFAILGFFLTFLTF